MKKKGRYQIVILREDGKQYHNAILQWFQVRKFFAVCSSIGAGLLIATIGFIVMLAWHGNLIASNMSLLRKERELRKSVDELDETLNLARNQLSQSEVDLSRLETLARKENLKIPEPALGVGGAAPEGIPGQPLDVPTDDARVARLAEGIQELSGQANLVTMQTKDLSGVLLPHLEKMSKTPSIWPTKGFISSRFGSRQDPINGRARFHEGLDISAPRGTPIVAPAKGIVTFCGWKTGYGKCVEISHGNGLTTFFAHVHKWTVKPGDRVERRQKIAVVGSTGRSTGCHLHYEVRKNGRPRNPARYLLY